ncbi:helix-turn-helix domain-containing protein [Lactobacillus jensenii]|uniref:S24 family peptidase n=2 Tax=Lactobacillus jensenii TaxID=109790 RepID=UPI001F2D382B|nr:S24 family peptidase [Lactobacillus jensenii]MCF1851600.1 helix-turn-helix domain-containing protein [Lactobacillus jensenii]
MEFSEEVQEASQNISNVLQKYRNDHNLSQSDVAKLLKVSKQSISNWESMKKVPSISATASIANLVGSSISELMFPKKTTASGMIQQNEGIPYLIGKNLTYLMNKQHETIPQLSDVTGAAYSSISDWRTGKKVPRSGYLEKIAQHYSVNISDLLFTDLENGVSTNEFQSISPVAKAEHQIPVIGIIACGEPILAEQNIEDYLSLVPSDDATYFGLKCRGHSMEPTIHDGAIAIIRQQPTVEDGEIAAVLVGEDANEATLKRVRHVNNAILLVPDNENFEPILGTKKDPIRIVGKAVRVLDIL